MDLEEGNKDNGSQVLDVSNIENRNFIKTSNEVDESYCSDTANSLLRVIYLIGGLEDDEGQRNASFSISKM